MSDEITVIGHKAITLGHQAGDYVRCPKCGDEGYLDNSSTPHAQLAYCKNCSKTEAKDGLIVWTVQPFEKAEPPE